MNPANNSISAVFDFLKAELIPMYGEREAQSMGYQVMLSAFNVSRLDLIMKADQKLSESQIVTTFKHRDQLLRGEPLQYILGSTTFYDLEIKVGPGVLIPRPETEELVAWFLEDAQENEQVWDIGTGSGCIALAIKKNKPSANVLASDSQNEALQIAKDNGKHLELDVDFIRHDILVDIPPKRAFSRIISNPPYILQDEANSMPQNVLKHEPHVALFTTINDPLQFYRKITEVALNSLSVGGRLYFECHEDHAQEVFDMVIEMGMVEVEIRTDMQGKSRMLRAKKI
jgi:release factor glutamine methyltransferase